ncbi:MAG: DUF294 nucleotidyltransferase-like domain-containing protein [Bacteroidales bacterium]|nr:DUF294 nucleotidyltransferase-like domain-containing protein [Bacteroidales bacterium]
MNKIRSKFSFNIIVPSVLSLILFVLLIFLIIIPYFEESIFERKKEMIKELTNSAWSILKEMDQEVQDSIMTLKEAQTEAVMIIKNLKYGKEHKDYFWITDMQPKMIIHPYRPDLKGSDLREYSDPKGKKLFVECINTVKDKGEGFVDYMWQYKEDSTHIVPKLSYVKGFENWAWVIGTGIYIEDVKEQISELTKKLIYISLIISIFIGLILYYLVHVNIITERRRVNINKKLNESYDKYKTLVEASTEGIVMILGNEKAFYNTYIVSLLGYTDEEFKTLGIYDILYEKKKFSDILNINKTEGKFPKNFDTKLIKKSGELHEAFVSFSRINFHGKEGFILAVKDISPNKDVEEELDKNIEKFKAITNNIDIGIFRTSIGRNGKFTEINKSAAEIIGCTDLNNIYNINILDLFYSSEEKKEVINLLNLKKNINRQSMKIKRLDGTVITAMVSLFLVTDDKGMGIFCDGIIQDITMQKKLETEKDSIIEELMTASLFMNQSVKNIARKIPACDINTSVHSAVKLMVKKNAEALLVHIEEGTPIGIITNTDLGERIVSRNIDPELPIAKVMSSPVITLPESAMLFEALMMMREKDVNHICIENSDGSISEAVNIKEIAYAKYQTHTLLIQRIKIADSYEELTDIFNSIPVLLRMLIKSGAKTDVITRINSNFSDEIVLRIMDMVIHDMEKPPVDFAFITLGSVGRGEQTFLTDQDNAIIYDDMELEKEDEVKAYFLKLGETLNLKLHEVGYNYCKGEIMAKNPKWCMSVSDWKKQFRKWIVNSNPQDLLEVNIFFDIRDSGRNIELTKILRDYIYQLVKNEMLFFYHLAENVLSIKPPISFFGNFIVESTKENKSVFDIKKVIMLITSIARLYALKNNVKETNTLRRLKKLNTIGVLTDNQYSMLSKNLNYLMLMRINHQLEAINKHKGPNNLINPKHLTDLERTSLKKIFSQLSDFHNKISLDFKGSIK